MIDYVCNGTAHSATLSTLERKRSSFEAKTPHLALEGVESSLLEV